MAVLEKRILRDASEAIVQVWGGFEEGETVEGQIISPGELVGATYLRLTTVEFAIQDGLTILLFWEGEDDHTLLLPLEGRGRLDYDWAGGLKDPQVNGWKGNVVLKTEATKPGDKHFSLVLEFAKCR